MSKKKKHTYMACVVKGRVTKDEKVSFGVIKEEHGLTILIHGSEIVIKIPYSHLDEIVGHLKREATKKKGENDE